MGPTRTPSGSPTRTRTPSPSLLRWGTAHAVSMTAPPATLDIANPGEAPHRAQHAVAGDWVLNTDDGRWEVLSDAEFHSGWEALG